MSSAAIFDSIVSIAVLEEFEGWISSDVEFSSEIAFFSCIDLDKLDFWVGLSQFSSSRLVFRSERLAVTTPWSIEFDKDEIVVFENLVEVFFSSDEDSSFCCDFSRHKGQ